MKRGAERAALFCDQAAQQMDFGLRGQDAFL